ncbi:hypothetical protein GQ457_02G019110 [Hibiscus cannabinus]
MVDGVLTRHQVAQLALETQQQTVDAQTTQPTQTQPLTWQQEGNRLQSEMNREVSQLKSDISQLDKQMDDMRIAILTYLQKMISTALGKNVESVNYNPQVVPTQGGLGVPNLGPGILGSPPNLAGTSHGLGVLLQKWSLMWKIGLIH